jgi:hypothetical protein
MTAGLDPGAGTVDTVYRPPPAEVSRTWSPVISVTVADAAPSPGSRTAGLDVAGADPDAARVLAASRAGLSWPGGAAVAALAGTARAAAARATGRTAAVTPCGRHARRLRRVA